jgi:hypothetical protein
METMGKDYLDQVPLRGATLTRKAVIAATKKHKASDGWKAAKSQKFVLVIDGVEYPPKKIASAAAGIPVSQFSGGEELNSKLRRLGFEIRAK